MYKQKLNIFLFVILCTTFSFTLQQNLNAQIFQIESLNQIVNSQPNETIYFFDIDDTLFDSPHMLGSKTWRKYIISATKDDNTRNWHDFFSLLLARNHPLKTVEPDTSTFVQNLQMEGYAVFGLTARERKFWYDTPMNDIDMLTVNQLNSLGLNFDNEFQDKKYSHLTKNSEYYKGVFFANMEPKGRFLLELFKDSPELPQKVIFIDDKQSQVESVSAALDVLGINNECYWYTATDEKAGQFDPLLANIQLYHFWISGSQIVITDEEAVLLSEQHPERDAEFYLQLVLHEAKT